MSIDFNASYTMTIEGHPVSSPETIAVVNPATEEVVATPPAGRFTHRQGRAFRSDSTATEVLYGRSGRGSCQRQRLWPWCLGLGRRLP